LVVLRTIGASQAAGAEDFGEILPKEGSEMSIDFKVRNFAYPVGILRLRRAFEKTQYLSPGELRPYQEERLRRIIHQAYHHVPYYRRIFDREGLKPRDIRTIEDLPKIPPLSREDVRANFDELRADNAKQFHPAVLTTSGTSGTPLAFLVDRPANTLEFVSYWRHWSWGGYRLGDCFADVRWDYFIRQPELTEKIWHFQPQCNRLLLNSLRISRDRIGEYAKALRKYRPKFIRSTPSGLYCMGLLFREKKLGDFTFRAAFLAGEVVLPEMVETIENMFACKAMDWYSHMERCVAASQCMEGTYHLNADYGILELRDEKKTDDGGRIGRVVCTSLHKMAMPFLRYELEDVLELYPEDKRCPCGRTLPLVKTVHGRVWPLVVTPEGWPIDLLIAQFQGIKGIQFFQFVHEKPELMLLRIVKGPTYTLGTEETVKLQLARYIGARMKIEVQYVAHEELERDEWGKVVMLVSHIPGWRDAIRQTADLVASRRGSP
jgi:phenylacetate-CoA ligase